METIRCLTKFIVVLWIVVVKHGAHASTSCADCTSVNVTCVDGECLSRCVIVTSSGECQECRDSKFYGKQCELSCPSTCLNSRCQLGNTGSRCTEGCVVGKKGVSCGVPCSTSCLRCERYGDKCVGSCRQKGYYGDYCDRSCPVNCNGNCNKDTGQCDTCTPGYAGRYCTVRCSTNCGYDCDVSNCRGVCVNGYKGKNCEEPCPPNCGDSGCDRDSGQCVSCKPGYRGEDCEETCPPTCGDSGCDRDSGQCVSCKPGYRGEDCEETCPSYCSDSGCDRTTGQCYNCPTGYWRGSCQSCPPNCGDGGCDLETRQCHNNAHFSTSYIVGVVLICLFVLICVTVVIYLTNRCRKRNRLYSDVVQMTEIKTRPKKPKKSTKRKSLPLWDTVNPIYERANGSKIKPPPRIKFCRDLKDANSEHQMKLEFAALPLPEVQSSHCGRLSENIMKNRYRDILPFDNTRVCLAVEDEDDSDYVNASYIDGYKQRTQFIATQGPTTEVLNDFWRMIWQCDVENIVMLTNLVEEGIEKCEMYWPSCGIDYKTYGNVSVQCVEEKVFEHHTLRTLAAWKANCWTRMIQQFHYTVWPAQGVPVLTSLVDFCKIVKNTSNESEGPTLVHCSAGVGRTGTYLALVHLIDQARFEGRACVFNCVCDLRFQRMKLVHTEEQYIFLYHVVTTALQTRGILPDNDVPVFLQCKKCWETDKRHPVVNGVLMVYNHLDRNLTRSSGSLAQERV